MHSRIIDWDKLKALYYVVKSGSFTRAAEKLGVCQSAVSRQINSLESRLGFKLFQRDGSRIVITDAGAQLFELAESMMLNSKSVLDAIHDKKSPNGDITITSSAAVASALIPQYMLEFSERYPGLRLHLRAALDEVFLEDCDVAIRGYMPKQNDLHQEPLFRSKHKMFASPDYLKKFGVPKVPNDLDDHRLLGYARSSDPHAIETNWMLNLGLNDGDARKPFATFNSSFALLNAANKGLGIVELEANFPLLMDANLVEVLPEYHNQEAEMYLITHKRNAESPKIKACAEFLKEKLSKY